MHQITKNQLALSKEINARIKFGSKLLSHACSITRRQALDAFAVGVRFREWHELHTHLNKASDQTTIPPEWLDHLKTALHIVGTNNRTEQLPDSQIVELQAIAARISGVLNIPLSVVLDQVLAKMCSAGAWSDVIQRAVKTTPQPLYYMDTKWEHLRETEYCSRLNDELEQTLFERDHSDEYRLRWLERTYSDNPAYLSGADHLSQWYLEEYKYDKALEIIDASLETILPLIEEYKFGLTWWRYENRPLLRMLCRQMHIRLSLGDYSGALDTAEYTLSYCPTDELQVRSEISNMLRHLGKPNLAKAWSRQTKKNMAFHSPRINGYWLTELVTLEGRESDTVPAARLLSQV